VTRAGQVAEVAFFWACGLALLVLTVTSDALAQLLAAAVCR
jgi:hypothetical protein